ncbi:hypothetical protein F4781DRAFT_102529 [Annulohypoxylon bovei var. microspora]|nr:hypothetical protein F4781DRAFT_102529 [Annulohypoxylon bovei var. microspora]
MTRSFRSAVAVLCLVGIIGVNGEDDVNKFTYPTADGLQYSYRDTIITAYEGNISAPLLYTFCRDAQGNIDQERLDHVNGPNTTASIILDFTVDKPAAFCWFNIRLDEPDSSVGANSVGFQYNSTEGERKTFSLSSATSSTSTSTSTSSPTSSSTSSSPTSSSTQSGVSTTNPTIASTSATIPTSSASASHSPGLSPAASAGVGVGVGLVGIAIGAGAVAFFFRRRKRRGGGQEQVAPSDSSQFPPTVGAPPSMMTSEYPKSGYYAQVPNNGIHEAPAFQDGVIKNPGSPYVPYDASAAGGGAPVAPRHEMDGTSNVLHEMP